MTLRLPTKSILPFAPLQQPSFPMEGGSKKEKEKKSTSSLYLSQSLYQHHFICHLLAHPLPSPPPPIFFCFPFEGTTFPYSADGISSPTIPRCPAQHRHLQHPKYYTIVTNVSSASLITITIRAPVPHPTRTQSSKGELHLYIILYVPPLTSINALRG